MITIDSFFRQIAEYIGMETYELYPLLAVTLVGLACGLVGSLVIGNRLVFFSDAMAHTAFAGVALSLLTTVVVTGARQAADIDPYLNHIAAATAFIGILVGISITWISEKTDLTHDTIIGVFFAASVGIGGMLLPVLPRGTDPDQLLFGSLVFVSPIDLVVLLALTLFTFLTTWYCYNPLVVGTAVGTLAHSRNISVRMANYLFIITLSLVVNLCLPRVGILLINALLVVPGAAAANLSKNMRQFFWKTVIGSITCAQVGYRLSHSMTIPVGNNNWIEPRPGGTIVLVAVCWFFLSVVIRRFQSR
jgi:zinc transport system permease protein